MSAYEIIISFLSIVFPLLLLYSAVTEKRKPVLIFTVAYFAYNLLNSILDFDLIEHVLSDKCFLAGIVVLLFFVIFWFFAPTKSKWLKYVFYIPTVLMLVSFYLKTSLPFRYYGTSIRVADVIEIIGILFLSYSITCKKVDGDIV